jgi:hypothetical protein
MHVLHVSCDVVQGEATAGCQPAVNLQPSLQQQQLRQRQLLPSQLQELAATMRHRQRHSSSSSQQQQQHPCCRSRCRCSSSSSRRL